MTIGFIEDCIRRARNHDSGIDQSVLKIAGFSTGVMRRMVSNICEEVLSYCEVGAYYGGTACAAINHKKDLTAYIFEDFSQPFGEEDVEQVLRLNLSETEHDGCKAVWLIEHDFFTTPLGRIDVPIEFFFYDGNHEREWQSKALARVFPYLEQQFLFMVDDFNWDSVRLGTEDGFIALFEKVKIVHSWHLRGQKLQDDPVWHNGVALYLCEKYT